MLDRATHTPRAQVQPAEAPMVEVVVISLATATERRQRMADQLRDLPHDWSFFDAHTSLAHPDLHYDASRVRQIFGRTLTPQELAIWSSHYTVITRFIETGTADYLLVFEDDVIVDTALPLWRVLDFCRTRGIHYLRLFGMYAAPSRQLSFFYDRAFIRYRSSPAGLQAYILSRKGARRMARAARRIESAVDLNFDQFWKTGLPIHALFPFPVIERFSPSSNLMTADAEMGRAEKLRLTGHRIHRRLRKMAANLMLRRSDARIRRNALDFEQIFDDHMDPR